MASNDAPSPVSSYDTVVIGAETLCDALMAELVGGTDDDVALLCVSNCNSSDDESPDSSP
jgi:hypothetical protein